MIRRLTRRQLLLCGSVGTAGALAALTIGPGALPMSADERIKQVLRMHLDYLQISDDVLDAFIRDYKADPLFSRYREFGKPDYGLRSRALRLRLTSDAQLAQRRERHIVAYFLLSTDFFEKGGDTNRPVSYTRYWDPYKLGCANQFGTFASYGSRRGGLVGESSTVHTLRSLKYSRS